MNRFQLKQSSPASREICSTQASQRRTTALLAILQLVLAIPDRCSMYFRSRVELGDIEHVVQGATLVSLGQQGYLDAELTATAAAIFGKSVPG